MPDALGGKIPTYEIRRMLNSDPGFYDLAGPFLSRREVVGELGSPVWDDSGKVWWLAVSDGAAVIGMIGLWRQSICSLYVHPESRGLAVGYSLLRQALGESSPGTVVKATATADSLGLFVLAGFKETGTRGRYTTLCLETPMPARV